MLIRFAPRPGAPPDPKQDRLFPSAEIRIGRAPGCDLRLLRAGVRFEHAVLRETGDSLVLQALPGASLHSGGQDCTMVTYAAPGDAARIGPFLLTLGQPTPAGERLLTVTPDPSADADEAAVAASYRRTFEVALPNVRLISSALFCLIAALLFVLPLSFASGQRGATAAAAADRAIAIGTQPRTAPGQISALWNVGAFSSVHAGFGNNCAHCHQAAFVHVASAACLNCHRAIGQHADPAVAPAADLNRTRCETCHHEHKGPILATQDRQADCVACHGDIRAWAPQTRLVDVRDFGTDHPQFAPALVADALHQVTRRVLLGSPDAPHAAPDASGLRFTHAKHLALATLNAPGNAACAVCHVPLPGGVTFQKVEFEAACARCHTLQFEPSHPEWRLPHGHSEEVASRIAGYYANATLAGESFPAPSSDLFAKPAAKLPPPLQGAALVSNQVAAAMMSSIARSACGQCHTVTPPAPGAPADVWKVAPVFVQDRYLPRAGFSHAAHATTACATCHAARTSDGGPLALLPGIATCRLCHAGEAGAPLHVASTCVSCHAFHDQTRPLLPPQTVQAAFTTPAPANPTIRLTEAK